MKFAQRLLIMLCFCLPLGAFAQSIDGNWTTQVPNEDGSMLVIDVTMNAGTYTVDMGGDGVGIVILSRFRI